MSKPYLNRRATNRSAVIHTTSRKIKIRGKFKLRPKAKKLIAAALAVCGGSQNRAYKLLGLPTQAQLSKMLRGLIRETPAMRNAVERADKRADRAFLNFKKEKRELDTAHLEKLLCGISKQFTDANQMLRAYCPKDEPNGDVHPTQKNEPNRRSSDGGAQTQHDL